jgi:putative peptidoglycan lipid II flippase
VNGLAAFTMVRVAGFGHAGLALTTSVVSTFTSLTLLLLLRPKIGGIDGREMLVSLVKILGAAAVMGLVCRTVVTASHALPITPVLSRIADVAIGIPAGAAAFYAAAAALRVSEVHETRDAVLEKIARRFHRAG